MDGPWARVATMGAGQASLTDSDRAAAINSAARRPDGRLELEVGSNSAQPGRPLDAGRWMLVSRWTVDGRWTVVAERLVVAGGWLIAVLSPMAAGL